MSGNSEPPDPERHAWVFDVLAKHVFDRVATDRSLTYTEGVSHSKRTPARVKVRRLAMRAKQFACYAAAMEHHVYDIDQRSPMRERLAELLPRVWVGMQLAVGAKLSDGEVWLPPSARGARPPTGERYAAMRSAKVSMDQAKQHWPELWEILVTGFARLHLHAHGDPELERTTAGRHWRRRGKDLYIKKLPLQMGKVTAIAASDLERWALYACPLDVADLLIHLRVGIHTALQPLGKSVRFSFKPTTELQAVVSWGSGNPSQ